MCCVIYQRDASQQAHERQPQRLASMDAVHARCVHVYDGDTIGVDLDDLLRGGTVYEIIRLHGIDAPERRPRLTPAASASTVALSSKCLQQTVRLQPMRRWRDPYHRIIARVYVHEEDLCAWMVVNGFARPLRRTRGVQR